LCSPQPLSLPLVSSWFNQQIVVFLQQLAEYQNRQKEDKQHEVDRRSKQLKEQAVDITPQNKNKFLWSDAKNLD
jgi:hypothetical protein